MAISMPRYESRSCRLIVTGVQPYLTAVRSDLGFFGLLDIFDHLQQLSLVTIKIPAAADCTNQIEWPQAD